MTFRDELDLLEQAEQDAAATADEMALEGVDRRQFIFMSAVAAAATTFGFGASALAQGAAPATRSGRRRRRMPPAAARQRRGRLVDVPAVSGRHRRADGKAGPRTRRGGVRAIDVFTVEKWTGTVPTSPDDIAFLPAHRLSALLKERRITSTELTKIYLDRLEEVRSRPALRRHDHGGAGPGGSRAAPTPRSRPASIAARCTAFRTASRICSRPRACGRRGASADFENRVIDEDAEIVVRLRDAGAVLIAKLATGLFAQGDQWYRGRTNNPWDIRRGSSGSSAGPSSATAAGCVAFGIGTETSGSIVSPARECGLSALRPTFGRVSRYGGMVLAWSQDRVGPICRTVEDCAMVFNVLHGVDHEGSVHGDDAVPLRSQRSSSRRCGSAWMRVRRRNSWTC